MGLMSMSEPEILPAPVIDLVAAADDKWWREQQTLFRMLPTLLQTHQGKYVAIHEGQVVDSADDLVTLATRVYQRHGCIPIYMDLVAERPEVVRIPHYRVLREA
jgi:hypothetical protein